MSAELLPLLMSSDPWELQLQRRKRSNCEWDHFGMGVTPNEIKMLKSLPKLHNAMLNGYDLPGDYEPSVGKNGYQVSLDVRQFRPCEINVKAADSVVIVEGNHDDRLDAYGSISRKFIRKYPMPRGFNVREAVSTLSSDGILTITVPPPQTIQGSERVIQIQQTGLAFLNIKDIEGVNEIDNLAGPT